MTAQMRPKLNGQPIVISYLRFSRPEQLKGDSVRRQLHLGDEWAKRHGLTIADTFRDLGISAFRGKNAAEGALSNLLRLADDGRIPRGSVLLVEQLDRLSRNALLEALELFLSIIRRGIKIVTLMDGQEYTRESLNANMQGLMYSIMQMSLAHEESAKKSERLAHAWAGKRQRIGEKVFTKKLPAWLKAENGKIVIDKDKVPVVHRIVKLVMDGYGTTAITKKLNAEFEGLARVAYFNRSYVTKIAHSRAMIGEFQPHTIRYEGGRRRREPVGKPIKGYYPTIIDEDTFYAMHERLRRRRSTGGRNSTFINLFLGILHDGKDGSRMQIVDKGTGRRYVSSAAILGRKGASAYLGFPVDVMERGILLQLHELILPQLRDAGSDEKAIQVESLEAQINAVERKIADTQSLMLSDQTVATASVVAMLGKLDVNRQRLIEQRDALRAELSSRGAINLDVANERLADVLRYYKHGTQSYGNDERTELRNIIRLAIERIDATLNRCGRAYWADLKIKLRNDKVLEFGVIARLVDRMKRDKLGHPVKGGAKGPPQFKVEIFEPRWLPMPSNDGKTIRVGSSFGPQRIDVKWSPNKNGHAGKISV